MLIKTLSSIICCGKHNAMALPNLSFPPWAHRMAVFSSHPWHLMGHMAEFWPMECGHKRCEPFSHLLDVRLNGELKAQGESKNTSGNKLGPAGMLRTVPPYPTGLGL